MDLFFDILGWAGMTCLLAAYGFLTAGRIAANGWQYQVLNLFGSAFLMTYSVKLAAWPSVVLNLIWVGIGIVGIAMIVRARSRRDVSTAE